MPDTTQEDQEEPTINDLSDHVSEILRYWWEEKGHTPEATKEVLYGIELGLMDQGLSANITVHEDSNDYEEE